MPILPHYAQFVIVQCWSIILQLVSQYWYERQLSRYQQHWLVTLQQQLDLTPLEQACAGFQSNNGRGAPILHPPARLVRALLVKYLHNLSLRQTEELIDNHLLIKWFVDCHLVFAHYTESQICSTKIESGLSGLGDIITGQLATAIPSI